ncbi:MAG TPA: hypothetical protein VF820_01120 [Patescibacteria group bacterium]
MTTIKNKSYIDQPCERCGSKKAVSQTWKETIATFTGTTEVEFSQIICTNEECQRVFNENIKKEESRQKEIKLQREEREKNRKERLSIKNADRSKFKI